MTELSAPIEPVAVVIRGWGSVSALGLNMAAVPSTSPFTLHQGSGTPRPGTAAPTAAARLPVAALPPAAEAELQALRRQHPAYRQLDRTVLLALLAAREARSQAGWAENTTQSVTPTDQPAPPDSPLSTGEGGWGGEVGVSIGSSRGATGRLEEAHAAFLADGNVAAPTSPLTTLGNVASWVAFDAGSAGAALSHSSTCSTALQALGNAVAWLRAGLATRFLAGGTEAPLTDFTLAQMQALGIYSALPPDAWPCHPGAGGASTFVLGEGAAVFALEAVPAAALHPGDLRLESVGFGLEATGTKTGLTPDGQHFQQAARQALRLAGRRAEEVDLLVLHSPGTRAGDMAERRAMELVFGPELPACTSNKWLLGHTLGASGALSFDYALRLLWGGLAAPALPFDSWLNERIAPVRPRRIMINAAGFGGNAACALVSVVG